MPVVCVYRGVGISLIGLLQFYNDYDDVSPSLSLIVPHAIHSHRVAESRFDLTFLTRQWLQ